LGDVLRHEGYRGYFEVDLLHDLDADVLYLGEVNPRLSGASPMTNLTTEAYADMPLFLFHLLEYMDVDYELDIDELNARWERGCGEDEVWGQLIMSETAPDVELFTATPRTGVWRLDDDGRASFARQGNDWATLLDESEAFFMRVAAPGDLRCEGAQLGVLVTRGHLQSDGYRLTERCRRWVKGMKAQFVSTPLAPATPIVSRLVARSDMAPVPTQPLPVGAARPHLRQLSPRRCQSCVSPAVFLSYATTWTSTDRFRCPKRKLGEDNL
jgi:biotin carboxylase